MYAIVDIAGQQYKVEKDQKIFVNRLAGEEGSKIDFDQNEQLNRASQGFKSNNAGLSFP